MKSSLMHLVPPVSRERIISQFPKWYTPEACLQFKEHFHTQVRTACQQSTGTAGLKISKVVVVGDLHVGKTSLINRFCKDHFDRDYKATIGVDFEIERFEIIGMPYNLQIWDTAGQEKFKCIASAYYRGAEVIITVFDLADIQTLDHTKQWLEDALRENEPDSSFIFLVGTKKDLVTSSGVTARELYPEPSGSFFPQEGARRPLQDQLRAGSEALCALSPASRGDVPAGRPEFSPSSQDSQSQITGQPMPVRC
ncbi:ras-related protein Rab-36 isoform X2 [Vidua macroura]|uniref:ras-related protein Rab-36 isoform X2 n=1 Tax=Vidua macroura TaxID=187451 RepID=UPI0023A7988D|nr:ras-related protein Rab-36 isoform X2 [Vidua macroura]